MDLRLPVDGVMGPETRSAIRSFQSREGLPEDGIAGPQVEAALVRLTKSQAPGEKSKADSLEEEELLSQGRNWRREDNKPERMLQQFSDEPLQEEIDPESPDHVQWLQRSLNRVRGLDLLEDGVHGPVTRSALRSFQTQHGLTPSGVLNSRTEGALMASGATQHRHPKRQYEARPLELYPVLSQVEAIGTNLTGELWEGEMNRGSRDYVRWVQQSLNRLLGLGLAVDGISGPQTRSAVRSFQKQRGLAVDGVVGPQTEAALVAAGSGQPPGNSPQPNLLPSTGLPYTVTPGQPYGPHWRARLPPGLPTTARQTSVRGAAVGAIQAVARGHGLGEVFVSVVSHLAQTESGATYARPANTFDARPPAERDAGKGLITAWGVFQFNRDAWRALPGVSATAFPWHASVTEEVSRPIARYAELFRQVRTAGGNELAAARGIRLWHRSPAAFRSYVRAGQSSGFDAAWRVVPERHRTAVDKRMLEIGLAGGKSEIGEELWSPAWNSEVERSNQEVSMIILSASVGNKGANKKHDVFPVQKLLNKFITAGKLPGINPLVEDGKSGSKTIAAIRAFQRRFVGMNNPDGRVDPRGATLQRLNGPINQPVHSPTSVPGSSQSQEPETTPAPFAPLPSVNGYWPVRTNHKNARLVSYRTVSGSPVGNLSRRFMANRKGKRDGVVRDRYHAGIDLYAQVGDPVVACEDGRIEQFSFFYKAKSGQRTYKLLVRHPHVVINYGEVMPDSLSKLGLAVGSDVRAGQIIGYVSDTSMLHFETYVPGTKTTAQWWKDRSRPASLLNPTKYLLHLQRFGQRG